MFNAYKMQEEKILYDKINDIAAYVVSKIETYDHSQFEQQVKHYISHYCEKYLHVKVNPQILNEFYDVNYIYFRDIVTENEHQQEKEMERRRM